MHSPNIKMLKTVAAGLGDLKDKVVFVGGAVAELYAEDPAASDIRPTLDVDCIIEMSSRTKYAKLEEELRAKGFSNDNSPGASICRWIYKSLKVDVMPTDEKILGFSNKWYIEGIKNKIKKDIDKDSSIFIFSPVYYLAAKLEAHKHRGGKDIRQSHDFEDIVYLLDNYPNILEDIDNEISRVRNYLKKACTVLLNNPNLNEGIESALPYGSGEQRVLMIRNIIERLGKY